MARSSTTSPPAPFHSVGEPGIPFHCLCFWSKHCGSSGSGAIFSCHAAAFSAFYFCKCRFPGKRLSCLQSVRAPAGGSCIFAVHVDDCTSTTAQRLVWFPLARAQLGMLVPVPVLVCPVPTAVPPGCQSTAHSPSLTAAHPTAIPPSPIAPEKVFLLPAYIRRLQSVVERFSSSLASFLMPSLPQLPGRTPSAWARAL